MRGVWKKALIALVLLAAIFWWLTRPVPLSPPVDTRTAERLDQGRSLFNAGGCASCHGTVSAAGEKPDKSMMGGGLGMKTPVGTFVVPNISPHPQAGIGNWTAAEFVRAMRQGVSPDNQHYYPAFPFTSYTRMSDNDVLDLWAYLNTLPSVAQEAAPHDLMLAARWRRGVGLWKKWFFVSDWITEVDPQNELLVRGRYLVEGPGHCGECHTPRNRFMALDSTRWLQGAASADGEGRNPNITAAPDGLDGWSQDDIEYYLESGVDPDFDVVGGDMVSVQENLAQLTASDRAAIAAYLKSLR